MSKLSKKYPGAALITGASAGLGEAFARRCASEGMDVVLVARRRDRLESLAREITREYGVQAHVFAQDLTLPGAAEAVRKACVDAGIQVSMLVNNAGFGSYAPFHETDGDWQNAIVEVNCKAPVALTSLFVPDMVANRNGAIIFLASTAAYQPAPMLAVYGASKAFSRMLGEALNEELKPFGIDVLSLSPGFTETEFHNVAQVKRLPPKEMFRQPDQVVAACFRSLGKQASIIDKVSTFEARLARWRNRWAAAKAVFASAASAGVIQVSELALLF